MKKFAFALLAMIGLASCTKEEGNKGVLKQDQPTTENMEKALSITVKPKLFLTWKMKRHNV